MLGGSCCVYVPFTALLILTNQIFPFFQQVVPVIGTQLTRDRGSADSAGPLPPLGSPPNPPGLRLPVLLQVAVDVFRKQREEHAISDRVIAELTAAKAAREAERREEAAISQRQQEVSQHQQVCRASWPGVGGID